MTVNVSNILERANVNLLLSYFIACPGGVDKPCSDHGTCKVSGTSYILMHTIIHSLLRVLVREMVKEHVNVTRDTLENCVTNAQLVIIMNPTVV